MSSTALTPEGAPLTPEEQKMVARIFSDPFYFPLQFKTWLTWFIEQTQGNVAGGAAGAGGAAAITGIPIGGVMFIAGSTLPGNCLWTDGAAYSRTTYIDLYREIGVQYGAGDGSTTFNVPDAQGRAIFGVGPHGEMNARGKNEGQPAGNRAARHGHSARDSGHGHTDSGHGHSVNDGQHAHRSAFIDNGRNDWFGQGQGGLYSGGGGDNFGVGEPYFGTSAEYSNISIGSGNAQIQTGYANPLVGEGYVQTNGPAFLTLLGVIRYV